MWVGYFKDITKRCFMKRLVLAEVFMRNRIFAGIIAFILPVLVAANAGSNLTCPASTSPALTIFATGANGGTDLPATGICIVLDDPTNSMTFSVLDRFGNVLTATPITINPLCPSATYPSGASGNLGKVTVISPNSATPLFHFFTYP